MPAPRPRSEADPRDCLPANKNVIQVHDIRTRYIGSSLQRRLHLVVDGRSTVREGHAIARKVRSSAHPGDRRGGRCGGARGTPGRGRPKLLARKAGETFIRNSAEREGSMKKERNYQPVLVVLVLIVIGVSAGTCSRTGTRAASKPPASRRPGVEAAGGGAVAKGHRTGEGTQGDPGRNALRGQGRRGLRPCRDPGAAGKRPQAPRGTSGRSWPFSATWTAGTT